MAEQNLISVFELCVRRANVVEPDSRRRAGLLAGKTAAFIDEWARMLRETDAEDPTVEEWREWACVGRMTAYRRQHDFRLLFGEMHATPTVLARYMNRAGARDGAYVPVELAPA
jgi:hypothetical protein